VLVQLASLHNKILKGASGSIYTIELNKGYKAVAHQEKKAGPFIHNLARKKQSLFTSCGI